MLSHLYGVVGQLPANPYWFCWSSSDQELREFYELNSNFSKAIETLGLNFGALTVTSLATVLVETADKGFTQAAKDMIAEKTNAKAARTAARLGKAKALGVFLVRAAPMVTIFAGVMHLQTKQGAADARREMMARDLLTFDEKVAW